MQKMEGVHNQTKNIEVTEQERQIKNIKHDSLLFANTRGSLSWTSRAPARILPSFNAAARACSSTRPPLAVLMRKAPEIKKID